MLLLSSFVAPPLYCVGVLVLAVLLFAALPFAEGNVALFLPIYFAVCLATSITIVATFTMITETVDNHEGKSRRAA